MPGIYFRGQPVDLGTEVPSRVHRRSPGGCLRANPPEAADKCGWTLQEHKKNTPTPTSVEKFTNADGETCTHVQVSWLRPCELINYL